MNKVNSEVVLVERRGAVLSVTMNRPQVLNVLDEELAAALVDAFSGIDQDDTIRAVILSGAGRSFMAGGDLTRFRADLDHAPETASLLIERFHALQRLIKRMRQPVIAAVHGPVAGGGVALALACDLVIASEDATFLSAYTKLGTNPDGGMTWSLTQLMGPRRALDFVLFNEVLDADAALRHGLVNQVVPASEVAVAAAAKAERLVQASAQTVATVKRLIQGAALSSFDEQLDHERRGFVSSAGSSDFREGITAFFEKRRPNFS